MTARDDPAIRGFVEVRTIRKARHSARILDGDLFQGSETSVWAAYARDQEGFKVLLAVGESQINERTAFCRTMLAMPQSIRRICCSDEILSPLALTEGGRDTNEARVV
jgi:hypothetical protein